jgi:hypothetical protein
MGAAMRPDLTLSPHQLAAVRAGWGALLLAVPGPVLAVVPGGGRTLVARRVAQVLGARQVLQAAAVLAGSHRAARAWWVDALHSSSMIVLATAVPAARRLAEVDAGIAAAFAIATHATAD